MTLEGKLLCAKCTLQEEGRSGCQNVLVVDRKGKPKYYYLTRNEVYAAYGEVCKARTPVRITGQVRRESGRKWIVASSIEPVGDEG